MPTQGPSWAASPRRSKSASPPYPGGRTSVALNNAGQGVVVWARGLGAVNVAATRSAAGTWSAAVQLSANEAGSLDVAIDGAGDAVATFEQYVPGTSIIALYASKGPGRAGSWGPPTLLSAPGDSVSNFLGGRVVADSAGTFVVAWTDGTTRTLNVLHHPARRRLRARRHPGPQRGSDQRSPDRLGSCGADLQFGGDHGTGELTAHRPAGRGHDHPGRTRVTLDSMSSPLNCLVTGASGYIGGRLVPELLSAGFAVRCMARDPGRSATARGPTTSRSRWPT